MGTSLVLLSGNDRFFQASGYAVLLVRPEQLFSSYLRSITGAPAPIDAVGQASHGLAHCEVG